MIYLKVRASFLMVTHLFRIKAASLGLDTKKVIYKSDDKATHIPNSKLLEILEMDPEEKWEKIQDLISQVSL